LRNSLCSGARNIFRFVGLPYHGWPPASDEFVSMRISVTNPQTFPTLACPDLASAMAEQQAMARAKRPGNPDQDIRNDPVAAALRQLHDAVAAEALPDDFLKLLDAIDAKIAENKASH
jgi:hypothetical protein